MKTSANGKACICETRRDVRDLLEKFCGDSDEEIETHVNAKGTLLARRIAIKKYTRLGDVSSMDDIEINNAISEFFGSEVDVSSCAVQIRENAKVMEAMAYSNQWCCCEEVAINMLAHIHEALVILRKKRAE